MARIEVEINGTRYIADSAAGPGRCSDCALKPRGKSCVWSMVCANVLEGAVFKAAKPEVKPAAKLPGTETEPGAENQERTGGDAKADYYERGGYKGD